MKSEYGNMVPLADVVTPGNSHTRRTVADGSLCRLFQLLTFWPICNEARRRQLMLAAPDAQPTHLTRNQMLDQ